MPSSAVQDAYQVILQMLKQYGLQSLGPAVLKFLQDGYTQDQVNIMIQDTPEYKQRFAGNDARRKNGLAALSPKEYLDVEAAYEQILRTYGMPKGFYDSPSDFASWIGTDVSPQEVQSRVLLAVDATERMDKALKDSFQQWYGVTSSNLAAFFLDQQRALPHIQRIAKAAQIGQQAGKNELDMNRTRAEELAGLAGDRDIDALVSQVASVTERGEALSDIYGGADYRQEDAESEVFASSEIARRKREQLGAMERAAFSGKSGVGSTTLSRNTSNY